MGRTLRLSREALAALVKRDWPGNARELRNTLRLAAIRTATGVLRPEHLETPSRAGVKRRRRSHSMLAELEARAVDDALAETGGHVAEAARLLGIDRTTLWRKMKRRGKA